MTIVASNSLTLSNINDGTITHYAYAYSADGTDGFSTVYPNLNLLTGTKDFSGTWVNSSSWITDGTYKGLTVKKRTAKWNGIYKTFTAPNDGIYTFSAYIKTSGNSANVYRYGALNSTSSNIVQKSMGNNFDWTRDIVTLNLKANDSVWIRYEISGSGTDSILWVAGYKYEPGSTVTPYMSSSTEVTTADWPSYIGQYSDFTQADSTNPSAYTWSLIRGNDGKDGADGKDGIAGKDGVGIKTTDITYAISTSGTIAPTTGRTSSVPSLVKGLYLWTKTVWTYTDNSSETGYSVTYISKDGNDGGDGNPGKDGVGILTTTITYAGSTSGTTAPTSGWTTTVPTVAAGSYLWTKTVWTYTDNTSETGYSVAMMGVKGERGKQIFKSSYESVPHNVGHYWSDLSPAPSIDNPPKIGDTVITPSGNILQIDTVNVGGGGGGGTFGVGDVLGNIKGPSGSNGDPGKIVSETEPTTRFKGLTWKYSGTTDLTASDGTVIHPNTEYYYNGTHWMIDYFSVNNFAAESITSDKIDGKNLTITDGEFVSTIIDGSVKTQTEIKDDHLLIYKMDTSHNEIHTIALKSDSGLGMTYQNSDTGEYTSAGVNFQGLFMQNNITNEFARLTPQGTKLSTDVPWTTLSPTNGFSGGSFQFSIQNGVEFFSISGLGVPNMNAMQWYQVTSLPAGSNAIPSINRVYPISGNNNAWDLLINPTGGIFIRCQVSASATSNLVNGGCGFPIG